MKQAMPAVWEEASQLRKLMQQQADSRLRTQLHLLYLLRTGVVTNRAQAAPLLGIGRNTVGQWLHQYERGGLQAVLALGRAPGKASSLPAALVAGMRAKLAAPSTCASFHQLWSWVEQTYHLPTTYFVIWYTATHLWFAKTSYVIDIVDFYSGSQETLSP